MTTDCDVCVIGSGAGAGPVVWRLAQGGRSVIVLEKGPWLSEKDFFKDEIGECRRPHLWPDPSKEPQTVEVRDGATWESKSAWDHGWEFMNGSLVGGSSNLMSGFFHRLKPIDFRLKSEFGAIDGASVEDWPITYDDMEPWYTMVEQEVGISGAVTPHPWADRRSAATFPFPSLSEHPMAQWIDRTCGEMGLHPVQVPRCILSVPAMGRNSCSYSRYCGNYGCATGAKGSSRAALVGRAVATGHCHIRPHAMVQRIASGPDGKATAAEYVDKAGKLQRVTAKVFVVACQAIESARLLLLSTGPRHPAGLGNHNGLVGKNLVFSTASSGKADFVHGRFNEQTVADLKNPQDFINRALQDWYVIDDNKGPRRKGGTIELMFRHPNPIGRAVGVAFSAADGPIWGAALKERLEQHFRKSRRLMFEVFGDWLPTPDGHVNLDDDRQDRFGLPVARVRIDTHPRNEEVATYLAQRGLEVLLKMGGENGTISSRGAPATNLVAGTCRFGKNPETSVLDVDCRMHSAENVFVTDGSFMPTGGSVPFTWTIYANSFRVAERIKAAV